MLKLTSKIWQHILQGFLKYVWTIFRNYALNPFVPNAPFPYPLKTSENCKVFWCFQVVEKRCIVNKWLKGLNIYFFPFQIKI